MANTNWKIGQLTFIIYFTGKCKITILLPSLVHLEEGVEGNPEQEDVGEELDQREGAVHHPVGQPLGIVILLGTLNCLHSVNKPHV